MIFTFSSLQKKTGGLNTRVTQRLFAYVFLVLTPCFAFAKLVGSSGLEPPTSRLSGVRSNHLSYEPIYYPLRVVVEMNGIEPMTPCLQSRCSPS